MTYSHRTVESYPRTSHIKFKRSQRYLPLAMPQQKLHFDYGPERRLQEKLTEVLGDARYFRIVAVSWSYCLAPFPQGVQAGAGVQECELI